MLTVFLNIISSSLDMYFNSVCPSLIAWPDKILADEFHICMPYKVRYSIIDKNLANMQESSLPDIFTENSWVSPNAVTRSRVNSAAEVESSAQRDPFDISLLLSESESLEPDPTMEEAVESSETSSTADVSSSDSGGFLEPNEVSISAINACFVPFYRGSQKIQLLHEDVILQLRCMRLKVRFGLSTKFVDHVGRPRLSIVVNASQSLCKVLDACDDKVKKLSSDSGSSSEWWPVVSRKDGFVDYPTVRLK
jgi:hypothetical protein